MLKRRFRNLLKIGALLRSINFLETSVVVFKIEISLFQWCNFLKTSVSFYLDQDTFKDCTLFINFARTLFLIF